LDTALPAARTLLPENLVGISQHRSRGPRPPGPDLASWLLLEGARCERLFELVDEVCWRLAMEGVPVWRSTFHLGTLHPQLRAHAVRWWRDDGRIEEIAVRHGIEQTAAYRDSPVPVVMERGEVLRRRLADAAACDFPILAEIRAAGGTDYVAMPLTFSSGRRHCVTFATDRAGGFADRDIERLAALAPLLSLVLELQLTRITGRDLLGVYLGRLAGGRVLSGAVRRGEVERIRAAILVADMRGFSALSRALPGETVVALLDEFFALLVGPIHARGGEVLKFVGDGLIAVFPFEGSCNPGAPANCAIEAALAGLAALDAFNAGRAGERPLRAGIALHVGEVLLGNIGAPDRLDFTVIGPAVNLASHLEALNKRFGCRLVASREFAAACETPLAILGHHPICDAPEPCPIYGLPAEAAAAQSPALNTMP
jgi:adenylate cyclase